MEAETHHENSDFLDKFHHYFCVFDVDRGQKLGEIDAENAKCHIHMFGFYLSGNENPWINMTKPRHMIREDVDDWRRWGNGGTLRIWLIFFFGKCGFHEA